MSKLKWYVIKVMPINDEQEPYEFRVETNDIKWTMEQYARNREGFIWEIVK